MTRSKTLLVTMLGLCTLAACGDPPLVKTNPPGFRKDVFNQEAASKIDVLWVIDNSGSMADKQQELSTGLSRFMELFNRGLVDYRIAVTTTDVFNDQGNFVGTPAIITPKLGDPVAAFQKNVKVGTGGKGLEQGLEAARLAIDRQMKLAAEVLAKRKTCRTGCRAGATAQKCSDDCDVKFNPEFMRPDAHLYLVFVSDEEDHSFGEVRYFQRFFESAQGVGNEGAVNVSAICGDAPQSACKNAEAGKRYVDLAISTGGLFGSICDTTFDKHLENLALNAVGLKRKFSLSKEPETDTLDVKVKYRCDTPKAQMGKCDAVDESECAGKGPELLGKLCTPPQGPTSGWTFETGTNALLFNGDSVPGLRSAVEVSYIAVDKSAH